MNTTETADSFSGLMQVITKRRTIRSFISKPIEEEALRKCLEAGHWAPSACNRQLWEFVVVDDPKIIRKLESITQQPTAHAIYIAIFYDLTKELPGSRLGDVQSAAIAAQNLMLVAHSLGYGTKMMAGLNSPESIGRLLKAPKGVEVVSLIAFGHPAQIPSPPSRGPLREIVHRNRFHIDKMRYPNHLDAYLWDEDEVVRLQRGVVRHGGHIGFFRSSVEDDLLHESLAPIRLESQWRALFLFPYSARYINPLKESFPQTKMELLCQSEDNGYYISSELKHSLPIHVGGFTQSGLTASSYDALLLLDSGIHLPRLDKTLAEIYRLLKAEGVLYISMPSSKSPLLLKLWRERLAVSLTRIPYWRVGPIHPLNPKEMSKMLAEAGFQIGERYFVSVERDEPQTIMGKLKLAVIRFLRKMNPAYHDLMLFKAFKAK